MRLISIRPTALALLVAFMVSTISNQEAILAQEATETVTDGTDQRKVPDEGDSPWHSTLEAGIEAASKSNKPLFVIVGAEWCVYCKQLEHELVGSPTEQLAKKWELVKLDSDERVSEARELRANGLPSLRLLSKDGLLAAAHDGYMPVDTLSEWLDQNYAAVKSNVPKMLEIDPIDYTDQQLDELVKFVAIRDVTVRRIVIDRLSRIPDRCVFRTIEMLESSRLANKLSALELLRKWDAPVEGLDPWIPGSIGEETIKALREWSLLKYPDALADT